MAKGAAQKRSTWDRCVQELQEIRSSYRIRRVAASELIQIKEIQGGKTIRQFSSQGYRHTSEEDIEAITELCKRAHKAGHWDKTVGGSVSDVKTWGELAGEVERDVIKRIAREGSRANTLGHLKQISKFSGQVVGLKLEQWAMERDPVTQAGAYRNRIETLSHINRTKLIELSSVIERLKAKRPTGAAKKELERSSVEVKAIPADEALEGFLDQQDGMVQWLLALIATYGLRPSEAWHAEGIDEDGWIVVPGDGLTKTVRHIAPPVPSAWLDRYELKENFKRYQEELNKRWVIKWEERKGLLIPTNNRQVTNCLWREMGRKGLRLWVGDEWVRPYDLRHSYAIRCFTHEETLGDQEEDVAKWMGHGVDVHRRTYLRFMTKRQSDDALKKSRAYRSENAPQQESPTEAVELPDDVLKKLEKLKKLEALLSD